uniref:S-layer homology domain-containing protein n=1 Tax=Bacillus velezensis TaxID=492670 RepID=UPI0020BEB86E
MKKRSIFMLLMLLISVVIWQPQSANADELSGHMHESGLRYLISKDALIKDANGSYRPNDTVTRGEFATYIAKALDLG